MTSQLAKARLAGLMTWAVGVQVSEGVATVGMALTALTLLPLLRLRDVRRWWPVWAWLGWCLIVPWLVGGQPPSGAGVARTFDWLMVPLLAIGLVGTPGLRAVLYAAGATLVLSSLAAGLQHFGVWPDVEAFSALEWLKLPFHRVYEPVPNSEGRFMGGGLLFHRLKFAHVSSLAVLVLTVVGAKTSGHARVGAWAGAAVGTIAVWFFPYARMASVALGASLLVTVALVTPNRRRALIVAGLIVMGGAVTVAVVEPLRARFLSALTTEGSGDRKALLEAGLRAIAAHPFTGVGAGQFRPSLFAPEGVPQYVLDNPGKAHNQFLSMAAEVGIPGAILFVLMLGSLAWAARRAPWGPSTLAGLTFFSLLSLAHDPLFQAPFSMALVLVAGAGLAELRRSDAP